MQPSCQKIVDAIWFRNAILGVILLAGVVVGLQTYPSLRESHGDLLSGLDKAILGIFIIEIFIKMGAHGRLPWKYFSDPWNVFDFAIVAVCLIPSESGSFAAVLRLARVLRVLRLVTALPKLQILVGAVLRSIPSIGYVFLLAVLLFYIYGCMGTFLYSKNDPLHFRNLQTSMLSLYRIVTFEAWTDILYINMYGSNHFGYDEQVYKTLQSVGITRDMIRSEASPYGAVLYFVSFTIAGAMILFNLFVGVMINGMEEAKREQEKSAAAEGNETVTQKDFVKIEEKLTELSEKIDALSNKKL